MVIHLNTDRTRGNAKVRCVVLRCVAAACGTATQHIRCERTLTSFTYNYELRVIRECPGKRNDTQGSWVCCNSAIHIMQFIALSADSDHSVAHW